MFFFSVFDLVVADAVRPLDEHLGMPVRATWAASWRGPEGRRCALAPVSKMDSSQGDVVEIFSLKHLINLAHGSWAWSKPERLAGKRD
jgi:hypothetical protein